MSDYKQVQDALSKGVAPADICSTCPWDRFCITPPTMTRSEVEAEMEQSRIRAEEKVSTPEGEKGDPLGAVMGTLMTSLIFSGKDTQATVCPVLVARMRSSEGRLVVDNVRSQMKEWTDDKVGS